MKPLAAFVALVAVASAAPARVEKRVTYDGFRVVRIPTNKNPAAVEQKLGSLPVTHLNVETSEHMDIAVGPKEQAAFDKLDLDWDVMFDDLGAEIATEGPLVPYEPAAAGSLPDISWFNNYHPYNDHVQFFKDLQAAFSSNSEMINAGSSYEGRNLYGIHMWGKGGKGKPAIYFHGTVHAREWISTMVVEYLTYKLIEGYSQDATATKMLDRFDFFILPVVNPDGFVYTQNTDRLWRKNRQPRSGDSCIGTDENRNWPDKHWSDPGGASTSTCSETYKGASPGDTTEMKGLVAFTQKIASSNGITLFIDWHSYGQYILIPYGYDCDIKAPNNDQQLTLAKNTAQTIFNTGGSRFTYGQSCSTLYATTGDSTDYMMGEAGAEMAWTIELRPSSDSSSGTSGFILPANQIVPATVEQWDAMKYLIPSV